MDLRVYYQKIRKIESEIPHAHVIVVSQETPDGGKAGVQTEVARESAARLVVEGRARLATDAETAEYHRALLEAGQKRAEQQATQKIDWTTIVESGIRSLKGADKRGKEKD